MLKKPSTYCVSGMSLLATLFVMVFIPAISLGGINNYYVSDTWTHLVFSSFIIIVGISSSIFGEMNAINNEKVYFLSKPIKRSTFLFAKCLASFTWAIITTFICSSALLTIAIYEYYGNKKEIVFDPSHGNNVISIFASFLIICCFCSTCATIWNYLAKSGFSAILFSGLVLIYAVLFPILVQLDRGDLNDYQRLLWVTLPIGIFSFLGIIIVTIGACCFMKSEVES